MLSLVIPVYQNEASLDRLLAAVAELSVRVEEGLEAVFVVDGSPDRCLEVLRERLSGVPFRSRLVALSRNFGSFCAIAAGLRAGAGDSFAVLAADLQEPPDLVLRFAGILRAGTADVVFGYREKRGDPWLSGFSSALFWGIYRRFVVKDMPKGGVDVFACTRQVRDCLLEFKEVNTNLIALLFWLGFRRAFVGYERLPRLEGKSAWTFSKKLRYCVDSLFSFTDLPLKLLLYAGAGGMVFAAAISAMVVVAKALKDIPVPGYAATVLAIMFFGGLTSLAFGIVGQYLWLCLQNSRNRPPFVVAWSREYEPGLPGETETAANRPAAGAAPGGER